MSKKTLQTVKAIIVVAIAALTGWSVASGNAIIPIPVIIIGLGLLYFLRKRVTEVIDDERIQRIDGRASAVTIQVYGIITALAAVIFLALRQSGQEHLNETGLALGYSVCLLLVVRLVMYYYYQRKY